MKDVVIVCETDGCENNGKVVNTVELLDCDLDTFLESFGQGGEEEADHCPLCKNLGIAYEEPEYRNQKFMKAAGREAVLDDLERAFCPNAGKVGHFQCGWCDVCDKPRLVCGHIHPFKRGDRNRMKSAQNWHDPREGG